MELHGRRKRILSVPDEVLMPVSARETAAPFVPEDRALPILREAVQHCHGCDLYRHATQAVFGELETGADAKKPKVADHDDWRAAGQSRRHRR